jgi:hypothetical protein
MSMRTDHSHLRNLRNASSTKLQASPHSIIPLSNPSTQLSTPIYHTSSNSKPENATVLDNWLPLWRV